MATEIRIMRGLEVHAIQRLDFSGGPIYAGRDKTCQLRISGISVSPKHFRIDQSPSGFVVKDLGSIFGTRVNGQPEREYGPLCVRDVIEVPGWRLEVLKLSQPESLPTPAAHIVLPTSSGIEFPCPADVGSEAARSEPLEVVAVDIQKLRATAAELRAALDSRQRDWAGMPDNAVRGECRHLAQQLGGTAHRSHLSPEFLERVIAEVVGLGPLERYLNDPAVTEIMVNGPNEIFVERSGVCTKSPDQFMDVQSLRNITERIFSPIGRRIDDSCPLADGRLPDGSRVNAVLSPPAMNGPCLTIRKFTIEVNSLSKLVERGAMDLALAERLRAMVAEKKNIVVSGGTGSGKTTLLRALAACIPDRERLITIEDAAELRLSASNIVALEAREANQEGEGRLTIRDLLRNALRMRPDRIIVGECRGVEAVDMLQAMNTGHEGSLTSVHANSPRDALSRLELMVLMAGFDIPLIAVREQIRTSIDVVVHQRRFPDGTRRVIAVEEVCGIESGVIQTQPIYRQNRESADFAQGICP